MLAEQTIKISGLSHDGRGIATLNGKTIFITGALLHEEVTYRITKKHSRYLEGEALEIISPSPQRTTPPCAHFGICGGCSLQHLKIEDQLSFKQNVLLEQLKHFGKVEPEQIHPPIKGCTEHYRRKARLGVRFVRKKDRVLVGFREKFSNYLADLQSCIVLHESVGSKISLLSELIASLSQKEHIPQIEVSVADNTTALVFRHLTPLPADDILKLIEFGKNFQLQIYLQPSSPASIHRIYPNEKDEKCSYYLPELEMLFQPLDFIQVNGDINKKLIAEAINWLQPTKNATVLDLFCGLGNFTLPIAKYAKEVVGIEGSEEMVQRAKENAAHNKIANVEFHAANLMNPSPESNWIKKSYDLILLDPPRAGAKEILPYFKHFSAKKIVYVSCNPATLARDAGELVYNYGYKLKEISVVNMFPHTSHIEAIALFTKE